MSFFEYLGTNPTYMWIIISAVVAVLLFCAVKFFFFSPRKNKNHAENISENIDNTEKADEKEKSKDLESQTDDIDKNGK